MVRSLLDPFQLGVLVELPRRGFRYFHSSRPNHDEGGPPIEKGWFRRFKDGFYTPDVVFTTETVYFFVFVIGSFFAIFAWKSLKNDVPFLAQIVENHMTPNYENVVENYRVHSLLLSAIGSGGDWRGLISAVVVLVSLSGNLMKTLQPIRFLTLYLSAHVVTSAAGLLLNYTQLQKVKEAQQKLANDQGAMDGRGIDIVALERAKQQEMSKHDIGTRFSLTLVEKKKKLEDTENEIKSLTPMQVLERAEETYRKRPSIPSGGFLGLANFFMLLHVKGRMPFSLFVPYLVFVPTISIFEFQRPSWARPEVAIQTATAFGVAATYFLLTKKTLRIFKWTVPDLKVTNKSKMQDVMGSTAAKLDPKALDAMRKRNEKFNQKKNKA